MKWVADPVLFCESKYGLNVELWKDSMCTHEIVGQDELISEFYNPKRTYVEDGVVKAYGPYKEFWAVAGMRCVSGLTKLVDCKTGKLKRLKDFTSSILTHSVDDGDIQTTSDYTIVPNGTRPAVKVQLFSGKIIYATEDHRFLTLDGWKQLKDINLNEQIATPAYIPVEGSVTNDALATFLAGIIAEGCTMTYAGSMSPRFTNSEEEIVEAFKEAVYELGGKIKKTPPYIKDGKVISQYDYAITQLNPLIRKYGVYNKKSRQKTIPGVVFTFSKQSLKTFLYWYWREDGGVVGQYPRPVYYSTSIKILRALQHLLLRFGIVTRLRYKRFALIVVDPQSFTQIAPEYVAPDTNHSSPLQKVLLKSPEVARRLGLSFNYMRTKISVSWQQNVSIWNLRKLRQYMDHPWLDMVTDESIVWDPIVKVGQAKDKEVFDVSVPETQNFIGNDIILHNSSKTWMEGTFGAIDTMMLMEIDHRAKYNIAPSSPVFGLCVASKEEQAVDTNFAQYKARLVDSPYFNEQIDAGDIKLYSKAIRIPKHKFTVRAVSSAVAGEVGKTIKFLLVDEVDSFEGHGEDRSGIEMYRRLTKGTMTFKADGHSFFCGSPWFADSMSMQKIETAKTDPSILAYHLPTWRLNPSFTERDFEKAFKDDPIGAMRDWAADPQAGNEVYFRDYERIVWDVDKINLLQLFKDGHKINHLIGNYNYCFTGDPAGPKSTYNGFGMALGHKEGSVHHIDGILRYQPTIGMEIDPIEMTDFMIDVMKVVPVRTAVFDTWNYPYAQEKIRRQGVEVKHLVLREPQYQVFKEAAYTGMTRMVYYQPCLDEIKRILKTPGGRIDHPRRGSKDVIDAVVQCVNEMSQWETIGTPVVIVVI